MGSWYHLVFPSLLLRFLDDLAKSRVKLMLTKLEDLLLHLSILPCIHNLHLCTFDPWIE
jgi:hypothetical protein